MEHQYDYINRLTEESRRLLKENSITSDNELISWMAHVPEDVLQEHFQIHAEIIEEIKSSELYLKSVNKDVKPPNIRGYRPKDEENGDEEDDNDAPQSLTFKKKLRMR